MRQGKPLERKLRRALLGLQADPFAPQRQFLSLVSTGDKYAVASRGRLMLSGQVLWRWKDSIDRRFMRQYNELPSMEADVPPAQESGVVDEATAIATRCGGCGAKIGSAVLERALKRLRPLARPDIVIGLSAPDDAAVVKVPAGKLAVHSVDFFRAFVDDPYVFGQVAANHALGDLFAMGAAPQTALALATLPYGPEAKLEEELNHLMAGALAVLNEAGCALVGGHTSESAELGLGFAVNGLVEHNRILRKSGMRPGDRPILTKPLGTATLFAADMHYKAKCRRGASLHDAIERRRLRVSQAPRRHGMHRCHRL